MSTRLNSRKRRRLMNHARKVVAFPALQSLETNAFMALRDRIERILDQVVRVNDREVLRRYRALRSVSGASFQVPRKPHGERRVEFLFDPRDVHEEIPEDYRYRRRPDPEFRMEAPQCFTSGDYLKLGDQHCALLMPLVEAWLEAVDHHDQARRQALADLGSLFRHKTTLEGVIEVWPPARDLELDLDAVALDDQALKRIKSYTPQEGGDAA